MEKNQNTISGKDIIRAIKDHYRSGNSNLGSDFFFPCMKYCIQYRRAAGYFTSGVLRVWAQALQNIEHLNSIKIDLLISPQLTEKDKEALTNVAREEERNRLRQLIADKIIEDLIEIVNADGKYDPSQRELRVLMWLIANERLELRFAFPEHIEDPGIFHEKIGHFNFPWGDQIAFTGSANETSSGHGRNYESIDVYRSWIQADVDRVVTKIDQFEEAWNKRAVGLHVIPLSSSTMEKVKTIAPTELPPRIKSSSQVQKLNKWRHQDEAVEKFLAAKQGILEMATGTGKTRTAIKIIDALDSKNLIDSVIVTTDGTDLLDQWRKMLDSWSINHSSKYAILRQYAGFHEYQSYMLHPQKSILVISRQQLPRLMKGLAAGPRPRILIIHDEVHGLGSAENVQQLLGQHALFDYRLGLSATPLREYDIEGNKFISSEIGDVIFRFELRDAIERGILCEFDYISLPYNLSENDKYRLRQVYARKSASEKAGTPMSKEEFWIELSKIYKTAELKPVIFNEYLQKNSSILQTSIIFVETIDYGARILDTIHLYTYRYRTYYADDERDNLISFAKGDIDCLITCHRISQGIDIQGLRSVILFSSSRAKLETIQRIGRCLRFDPRNPDKRATIVDFVRIADSDEEDPENSDTERSEWLTELSRVKRRD